MLGDNRIPSLPEGIHQVAHFLGVQRLGTGVKTRDTGKENGDLLTLLGDGDRIQGRELVAQSDDCEIYNTITQSGTLRLQLGNGLFKPFTLSHETLPSHSAWAVRCSPSNGTSDDSFGRAQVAWHLQRCQFRDDRIQFQHLAPVHRCIELLGR